MLVLIGVAVVVLVRVLVMVLLLLVVVVVIHCCYWWRQRQCGRQEQRHTPARHCLNRLIIRTQISRRGIAVASGTQLTDRHTDTGKCKSCFRRPRPFLYRTPVSLSVCLSVCLCLCVLCVCVCDGCMSVKRLKRKNNNKKIQITLAN